MGILGRVKKELKNCENDKDLKKNGVTIEMIGDAMDKFKGTIKGPPDTPFAGGIFIIDIQLPEDYVSNSSFKFQVFKLDKSIFFYFKKDIQSSILLLFFFFKKYFGIFWVKQK